MLNRVMAVLLPVLISGLWAGWLLRPAPESSRVSALTDRAIELDVKLENRDFEMLILGNSAVTRNIEQRQLSYAVDRSVLALGQPSTLAPTWYVVLRDRVYGRDLNFDWVVIADTPNGMLAMQPSSPQMHNRLREIMTGPDPVEARMSGAGGGVASELSRQSSNVRYALVDGLRNTVAGLLYDLHGAGTLQERGQAKADAAVLAVLGDGGTAASGLEGAMQPLAARMKADDLELIQGMAAESFLIDIIDLVEAHNGRVIVVHLPRRDGELDPGAFEGRADIVETLNERSVPYIDLSGLPTTPAMFMDRNHMSAEGKKFLTTALAEAMLPVLHGGEFVPAVVPGQPVVFDRTGSSPPLLPSPMQRIDACTILATPPEDLSGPAVTQLHIPASPLMVFQDGEPLRRTIVDEPGCSGTFDPTVQPMIIHPSNPGVELDNVVVDLDTAVPVKAPFQMRPLLKVAGATVTGDYAYETWVYPGTTLTMTFPGGWDFDDATLQTSAVVVREGPGNAALTVADNPVALVRAGRVLRTGAFPLHTRGTWTITWSSPEDGPLLLLRDVEVGTGDAPIFVIGSVATSGVTADFLPSEFNDVTLSFASEPPPLSWVDVQTEKRGTGTIVGVTGPILPASTTSHIANKKACSPVVVEIGGRYVDARPSKDAVQFDAPRRLDRDTLQAARPALNPERRCTWWPASRGNGNKGAGPLFMAPLRTARWVYPGDVVTFTRPDIAEMHGPAVSLVVESYRFGPPADLTLTLRAGSTSQDVVVPAARGMTRVRLPLSIPLDPMDGVQVDLYARGPIDDPGFFYLTDLHLAEVP